MLLIVFQVVIQTINSLKRNGSANLTGTLISALAKSNTNTGTGDISATSISEITGIPRATCIRKLDKFVKMKVLQKNSGTKRYSLIISKNSHIIFQC